MFNQLCNDAVIVGNCRGIGASIGIVCSTTFHAFVCVCTFLRDTGMFDKLDPNKIAKSFPSDWSLQQMTSKQAAQDTMSFGIRLLNKKLHLAADKGTRKELVILQSFFLGWSVRRQRHMLSCLTLMQQAEQARSV